MSCHTWAQTMCRAYIHTNPNDSLPSPRSQIHPNTSSIYLPVVRLQTVRSSNALSTTPRHAARMFPLSFGTEKGESDVTDVVPRFLAECREPVLDRCARSSMYQSDNSLQLGVARTGCRHHPLAPLLSSRVLPVPVGGSFSARVPRSSAELHR